MRRTRPALLAVALAVALVLALPPTHAALAVDPADRTADGHMAVDGRAALSVADDRRAPGETAVATVVRNETNTTNYLTIEDGAVERERFGNASLDVGSALAADVHRLRGRQRSLAFELAFERASGKADRIALVREEIKHIEARITTLKRRQENALGAFNTGDIDAGELLRRLVAVDVEARQLQARLRTVEDVSQRTLGFRIPNDLVTRMNNVRAKLVPVRGNVRAHAERALAGERNATSTYVLTSANGVVLAVTDDRTFVREAYLADRRQQNSPDQFRDSELPRISVANQRAAELYGWTYSIPAPPSIRAFGNSTVYNVSDTHPHGKLVAYIDGATRDVYREIQVKRLNAVPTRNLTATNGTVRVRVNRTHATGPMQLSVTDLGDPVEATVLVNGQPVGTTGRDGTLWTVTPHDGVRIEVRTATGAVVRVRFFAQ